MGFPVDQVTGDRGADNPAFRRAGTSDALDGRAEEGEGQQASQTAHGAAVQVVTFLGQTGCQAT